MSALTNEEILEAIKVKPALELAELVKMMEETFGVSAAAPVAVAAAGGAAEAEAAEEKTSFDVVLEGLRRQQDRRHQGRSRAHQPGSQGGQGRGRGCSQGRARGRQQGQGRRGQGQARGRRRRRHHQVDVALPYDFSRRAPQVAPGCAKAGTQRGPGLSCPHKS